MIRHLLTIDLDDVAQRMIDLGYNTQAIQDAYPSAPEDWSSTLLDALTDTYNLEGEITNIINQTKPNQTNNTTTTMKPKLIDISQDEFDTLMERHLDDIEFTDFQKKTIMNITTKETEWFIPVEDTYLIQSENITAGVTTYHKRKLDQICNSYPFEDGYTYYTIENGLVIESVWDEQSEEVHDDNPDRVYYKCHGDAVNAHKAQLLEFLSNNLRADHYKDQRNLYQSAINYITSTDSTLCSNCGHDLGYGYMDCGAGIAGDCPECGHNNKQLH